MHYTFYQLFYAAAAGPLTSASQIYAGFMAFDEGSVSTTIRKFFAEFQKAWVQGQPRQLSIAPIYFRSTDSSLKVHFMWSEDDKSAADEWVERVSSWAKLVHSDIKKTTFCQATDDFANFVPPGVPGPPNTLNVRNFTPTTIDILARHSETIPTTSSGFAIHIAPQLSRKNLKDSVFEASEPHMMVEIIEAAPEASQMHAAHEWASLVLKELRAADPSNVLDTTYISLTPPGANTLSKIFGKNYETVVALKKSLDPKDVFNLSIPFAYLC
jgi:hypothetical protein